MIDIHSHILSGVDDGPATLEESVAMVRIAAEAGTTDIVATPHANLEYTLDPELIGRKIAELEDASRRVVRIHRGCDFHMHFDNIQDALANPSKYAVNHKCYVLVEFSELLIARTTDEVLSRMRAAGLIPVITHPERNSLLQRRMEQLAAWVRDGCCLQVTAQSLLDRFGKRARQFSDELFQRGLVHFVASDAHDTLHRPPRLDGAWRYVAGKFGETTARRVFVLNPGAVITGEPLPDYAAEPPDLPRKWYQVWR